MKVTRRQLAGALLGAPPLLAQAQPEPAQPETAAELLAAGRERIRRNVESLAKVQVPMNTEPAFSFRAL